MDEDEEVGVALRRIDGRTEQTDEETGPGQGSKGCPAPRQQGPGQAVETSQRSEAVETRRGRHEKIRPVSWRAFWAAIAQADESLKCLAPAAPFCAYFFIDSPAPSFFIIESFFIMSLHMASIFIMASSFFMPSFLVIAM